MPRPVGQGPPGSIPHIFSDSKLNLFCTFKACLEVDFYLTAYKSLRVCYVSRPVFPGENPEHYVPSVLPYSPRPSHLTRKTRASLFSMLLKGSRTFSSANCFGYEVPWPVCATFSTDHPWPALVLLHSLQLWHMLPLRLRIIYSSASRQP